MRRSTAFYTALSEAAVEWESPAQVACLSLSDWYSIIQTNDDENLFDLQSRFQRIMKFSEYLVRHKISHISELVPICHDANKLLKLLLDTELFEDEFLKRAQVTITLTNNLMLKYDLEPVKYIDKLSLMADYRLPQLLYNCGVLRFVNLAILDHILKREFVPANSVTERTLRAAVIVIGEQLAEDLGAAEYQIDQLLWKYAQERITRDMMPIPSMLVPTTKY
jgi:hypothetical protein